MSVLRRVLLVVVLAASAVAAAAYLCRNDPGSARPCETDDDCGVLEECVCDREGCGTLNQRSPSEMLNRCYRRTYLYGRWWWHQAK